MKLNFLMSDDNEPMHKKWKVIAANQDVNLFVFKNWEEAEAELIDNYYDIHGIILDARGQRDQNRPGNDSSHISEAFASIRQLKKEKGYLPATFIYTGYKADIVEFYRDFSEISGIYDKTTSFDDLIKSLKEKAKVRSKIQIIHKDVFEAFDGKIIIDKKYADFMNDFFMNENEFNLNKARKILENILKSGRKLKVIPDELFDDNTGTPSLKNIEYYFTGNPNREVEGLGIYPDSSLMNTFEKAALINLKRITNTESHDQDIYKSPYVYKSALNSLCVLVLWVKRMYYEYERN